MRRRLSPHAAWVIALVAMLGIASQSKADDLKVDGAHSFVVFGIHHLGAGYTYGTFANPSGTVGFDRDDLSKTTFDVSVNADTLDTRNDQRDKDLKGPDFFDVKQFPTITFKSTAVKKTGDNTIEVTGDLTLKGVTKSVTVTMEMTGRATMMGARHTGFRTTFTIKRSDFGMNYDPPPVIGDEVELTVAIEAIG